MFALLTYLGACAAALKYRVPGEKALAVIGAIFCVFVIGWSTAPVLYATLICLAVFVLLYLPLRRQRYLLPDAALRSGESALQRDRHTDPENSKQH